MATERRESQMRTDQGHRVLRQPNSERASPGQNQAQRVLGIVSLLASGEDWPARRIAENLHVTSRTILRDMKLLETTGLAKRAAGPSSAFRLVGELSWERPQLAIREIISLLILAGRGGDDLPPEVNAAAWGATARLIAAHPARRMLEQLAGLLAAQDPQPRHWLCRQEWLPLLLEAQVNHWPLHVELRGEVGQAGNETITLVPRGIEVQDGRWVLRGYEVGGTDVPPLALGRVNGVERDNERA